MRLCASRIPSRASNTNALSPHPYGGHNLLDRTSTHANAIALRSADHFHTNRRSTIQRQIMPLVRPRFSTQLSLLRALAAALCASLVAIVWLMASCTEGHRIASAKQRASDACDAIASHYTLSLPHAAEPNVQLLHDVLNAALAVSAGIEGASGTLARRIPPRRRVRPSMPVDFWLTRFRRIRAAASSATFRKRKRR